MNSCDPARLEIFFKKNKPNRSILTSCAKKINGSSTPCLRFTKEEISVNFMLLIFNLKTVVGPLKIIYSKPSDMKFHKIHEEENENERMWI